MFEAYKERTIGNIENVDAPQDIEVLRPIGVELFLCGTDRASDLPEEIASNPILRNEASKRRELYGNIGKLFEKINDVRMDVDEAVDKRLVQPEELAEVYEQLSIFIEEDDNNARIILYLPFQLLPDFYNRNTPDILRESQTKFADRYFDAWVRLLFESDYRANFTDGDILEPGMKEPPSVRKAAHLIPRLLEKGILTGDDVVEQIDIATGEELLSSLAEGVVAARDKFLIAGDDWERIQGIGNDKPAVHNVLQKAKNDVPKENPSGDGLTPDQIYDQLDSALESIADQYALDSSYVSAMSVKRAVWEKGVRKDESIDKAVKQLAEKLQKEEISIDEIRNSKAGSTWPQEHNTVGIRVITQVAEQNLLKHPERAQTLAARSLEYFNELWSDGSPDIKDEIIKAMCHFRRLDLVQDQDLQRLGITLPDLSATLPVRLNELVADNVYEVVTSAQKITEDTDLSRSFFPYFMIFGSRVKGYAALEADIDVAMFVKPEASWDRREEVHKKLQTVLPGLPERNEMPQIWLEKEPNGVYGFREVPEESKDQAVTGPGLVHFIFGGVWVGQGDEGKKIRGDLLGSYLDLSRYKDQKNEMRYKFLRRLEMDTLQYRLMHKGYKRYYPSAREKGTQNSDLIDWESDFWDPGYRRVATQLFLSRVFLPDLSKQDGGSAGQ